MISEKGGDSVASNAEMLSRIIAGHKAVIENERKASDALKRAKAAAKAYQTSVAGSFLKTIFDLGMTVEELPFVVGAVLDAKSRHDDSYFVNIGLEYMNRGRMPEPAPEEVPSGDNEDMDSLLSAEEEPAASSSL